MTKPKFEARQFEEIQQSGGCNGQGGKVRKVLVAYTVRGSYKARHFGSGPQSLERAKAWANVLNDREAAQ